MALAAQTIRMSEQFQPFPNQKRFQESAKKFRAYIGGYGSGKTVAGCHEAFHLSMEYPGNLGIILRETYEELRDTTMRTFFEEIPEAVIESFHGTNHHVTFTNGSEVLFRSIDRPTKFKSHNLGWFYIDEASDTNLKTFRFLSGRLRKADVGWRGGWITSNPPDDNHWIHDMFVKDQRDDCLLVQSPTRDNPFLPDDYISSLEALYPPEWVEVYLEGKFGFTADGTPVYKEFNAETHVKDTIKAIPGLPILRSWDFGYRNPCVLYGQKIGTRLFVLGEFSGKDIIIDDFGVQVIADSKRRFGDGATYIDYGDSAGNQISDKSDRTSIQILRAMGVAVQTRVQNINSGILLIRILLKVREDGLPGILVHKSCNKLVKGFQGGYHFPDKKDQADAKATPKKDNVYDHLQDVLRYMAFAQPDFRTWLKRPKIPRKPRNTFNAWNNATKTGMIMPDGSRFSIKV